jgi:hypothetical protein
MVSVGVVHNPQPRRLNEEDIAKPCAGVRYLAGLYTLDERGGQVGMNGVEQRVALSDGGSGLENFFEVCFPRAVKVVDFRHPTEYLTASAKELRSGAEGEELLSGWSHRLKHEGVALLGELERLGREGMEEGTRAEYEKGLAYYRNQVGRMKCQEYLTWLRVGERGCQCGRVEEKGCLIMLDSSIGEECDIGQVERSAFLLLPMEFADVNPRTEALGVHPH